jgi:Aspartyl protease
MWSLVFLLPIVRSLLPVLLLVPSGGGGFALQLPATTTRYDAARSWIRVPVLSSSTSSSAPTTPVILGVVAPLKWVGPYPCLTLRFPSHNNTVLDFLLDTGANINSLDSKIVGMLQLPVANRSSEASVLVGTTSIGGSTPGGDIHWLGECQLVGIPNERNFTFVRDMIAASLSHASPVGDGILGNLFFASFAGVEWDWYGSDGDPPSVAFYCNSGAVSDVTGKNNMTRVALERFASQVFALNITVNGTHELLTALLDTGSPVTVFSQRAAEQAGILFTMRSIAATGVDGEKRGIALYQSKNPVTINVGDLDLGTRHVFVGDLPGLALIGKKVDVVLGLDFLVQSYRMILCVGGNALWLQGQVAEQRKGGPPW